MRAFELALGEQEKLCSGRQDTENEYEWRAFWLTSGSPVDTGFESGAGEENCLVHRLLRETGHTDSGSDAGTQNRTDCAMLRNLHLEPDRRCAGQQERRPRPDEVHL